MKIFSKMLLLVILGATVPLVFSHHFAGLMLSRILRDHIFEDLAQSVGEVSERVETRLRVTAQALSTASAMVSDQQGSQQALHQALEISFRGIEGATAVVLLDADGKVMASPYYPSQQEAAALGREPVTTGDLELFAKHIPYLLAQSTDIAIGSVYRSTGGNPRVAMAKALGPKHGSQTRIIAVERALDDVCDLVASYEYTPSRDARILDGKGRTVCGPDGLFPSQSFFYQIDHCSYKQADTGLSSFKWTRDKSVQCDVERVKNTDWSVLFERSHGELAVSMSRQIDWTLWWIIIAIVIAVVGGIIFAKALTRPIAALQKGASAIASGNYDRRIEVTTSDEVGSLAKAFEHMRIEIQQWNTELTKRVENRTRALKEAREQILQTQKLAAIGELGSGVAHEINNPLTSVVGTAQLLLEEVEPNSQIAQGLNDIVDGCRRVAAVVEALLRFSQSQTKPGMDKVDIASVVDDLFVINMGKMEKRNITTEAHIDENCRVIGRENDLRVALNHLFDNALHAMKNGGEIRISVQPIEGGAVGITVSDTGKGMSEEVRLRAVDPFYTSRPSDKSSSGIGLTLVHQIVTEHNGRVVIESVLDVGTKVSIYLPGAPQLSRA